MAVPSPVGEVRQDEPGKWSEVRSPLFYPRLQGLVCLGELSAVRGDRSRDQQSDQSSIRLALKQPSAFAAVELLKLEGVFTPEQSRNLPDKMQPSSRLSADDLRANRESSPPRWSHPKHDALTDDDLSRCDADVRVPLRVCIQVSQNRPHVEGRCIHLDRAFDGSAHAG